MVPLFHLRPNCHYLIILFDTVALQNLKKIIYQHLIMGIERKYILVLLCTSFTLAQAINGKILTTVYKVAKMLWSRDVIVTHTLFSRNNVSKYLICLIQIMWLIIFTSSSR